MAIIRNVFRCRVCKEVVESKHSHDFQQCKCGNFTDGGLKYIRRGGVLADFEDMSMFTPDDTSEETC